MLDLASGLLLGRVVESDSSRTVIELHDPSLLGRVTPADLVSLSGRHAGERLLRFMSILGENVAPEERLELGRYVAERDAVAVADGNRLFQRHAAVLGSTGSGKSWTVALMLERAAQLAHPNIIVFDLHGEYAPLARGTADRPPIARGFRVAGPGDRADTDDVLFVPYWLLDRDEMLSLVLDESDPDAPNQAIRFSDHVHKLKISSLLADGYEETAATVTVDSPVPYALENLLTWLTADDEEKIVTQPSGDVIPGPFNGRLTRFISRLQARLADGRYAFMFNPPDECREYEWLVRTAAELLDTSEGPGIKVIDFSEVPAEAVPVVAGVLARPVFDIQFWTDAEHRTPLCFICDEAHLYVGEALLLGDALLLPTRVKLDPPLIAPSSATRAFWNDWADHPSSAAAIVDGVEALRRQVRPSGWRDAVGPLTR